MKIDLRRSEAYVLAGELHRANGDWVRAFDAYDARLHAFVAGKQKAAIGFRGFFAPETALGLKVRNAMVQALALPFLARRLVERSLRDDFAMPDYLVRAPGA